MRIRSRGPLRAKPAGWRGRRGRLGKNLVVCLLPLEEDARFVRRYEEETAPVGERFDVIKNYLLVLINVGRRTFRIRGSKDLPPQETHIIEKYHFSKFNWFTRYRIPIFLGRRRFHLNFEIPDHLPDESDYIEIPVLRKRAYRLSVRVEKG